MSTKNIILLITDTYRYDNLGDRSPVMPVRTPELDRFACEHAAEITGFRTGSFPTIPHRTDVATGRTGWPHYGWQPIERSSRNHIASLVAAHGYATQLICDCPHLFNAHFNPAFHAAFQHRGQEGDRFLLHLNDPIRDVMPMEKTRVRPAFRGHPLADLHRWMNRYPTSELDLFPAKTAMTAMRWLEENSKAGPFFLWVDFFDPHEPWDAPEYLVRRYDPDYSGTPMIHPNYGPSDAYTDAELRNLRAHYAAEAELVDRWLGRVLQKIDDLGLWEDSVVIVTSDHGMSIGEHRRTGKSNIHDEDPRWWPIYPEICRVPFLIAAPDVPAGATFDFLAQAADILPTLRDLAGVPLDPPEPFTGRSFAGLITRDSAKAARDAHRSCIVSGCFVRASGDGGVPAKASTPFLTTADGWGYAPVGAAGKPELYDLDADPQAEHDRALDDPEKVRELHDMFLAELVALDAPPEALGIWGVNPRPNARGEWAVDYPA